MDKVARRLRIVPILYRNSIRFHFLSVLKRGSLLRKSNFHAFSDSSSHSFEHYRLLQVPIVPFHPFCFHSCDWHANNFLLLSGQNDDGRHFSIPSLVLQLVCLFRKNRPCNVHLRRLCCCHQHQSRGPQQTAIPTCSY